MAEQQASPKKQEPSKDVGKSATAAKGSAKKTKKYQTEILWTVRVEQAWEKFRAVVAEILRGLRSPDRPTRRGAWVFLIASIGLIVVLALAAERWWASAHSEEHERVQLEEAKKMSEFLKKQSDEARAKFAVLNIGTFTVELKELDPPPREVPGVMNLAELEVVLECDNRDTRIFMEDNLDQVRNQVTNVLTPMDREDLMSRDGKKKLRKRLLEKLNIWLPKGKVEDLYFSKLVVS